MLLKQLNISLLFATAAIAGGEGASRVSQSQFSHFIGLSDFSSFTRSQNGNGETVLSSETSPPSDWNELIVSWNADAPPGTFLKVEASATGSGQQTKFYTMGTWSPDDKAFLRASLTGQKDADGDVKVDTLVLSHPARAVTLRLTLGGAGHAEPALKFLGLSFCNTAVKTSGLPPNRNAWGKIIAVTERSQQSYPGGNGWCSPTSLSMILSHWAAFSHRPDWDFDVPAVAAGVFDHGFYHPTGNWPFNTAFAGKLKGMRSCVARFSDVSELEDWIAAGIPVAISARWDLLQDGRPEDLNGHLTVCRGFTENGDLVINDPWTDIKVESVRHVYKRENVVRAWATSHNTVYLVYPENWPLPADRFGHW